MVGKAWTRYRLVNLKTGSVSDRVVPYSTVRKLPARKGFAWAAIDEPLAGPLGDRTTEA